MPRFEVMWSLVVTVLAIVVSCFAIDTWDGPPSRSWAAAGAVMTLTAFAWFVAACMWREALRKPNNN